jgi:hypothetical protein
VDLTGDNGSVTLVLEVKSALSVYKNLFEKGQVDVFHFHEKGEAIGRVSKLAIGHDGNGMGADWLVEYVNVIVNNEQRYTFNVNKVITTEKHEFSTDS